MLKLWILSDNAEVPRYILVFYLSGTMDVTEQQFTTYMSKKNESNADEADLIKAFQVFDKDACGTISTAELRFVLCSLGQSNF